jgi:plasmid maintenance system antidote protein VapI
MGREEGEAAAREIALMSSTKRPVYNVALYAEHAMLRGWSRLEFARRAKVPYSTLVRFLEGQTYSPRVAVKLAAALGSTPERYLLTSRRKSA